MCAIVEKMEPLKKNLTWEFVQILKGKRGTDCKWMFKTKLAIIEKGRNFKARLIEKGFSQ